MWTIPNPLTDAQGQMTKPENWDAQRAYLADILASDLYGVMPPAPGNVSAEKIFEKPLWDGAACFEVYDLSFGPQSSVHEKTAVIRPAGKKAVPLLLCGGYVEEENARMAFDQGFCIVTPLADEAAPDEPDYQKGSLYQAYPEYSFKVIAMWGWMLSRVIDWLETADFVTGDPVTVIGHSRFGKAALSCAVYDERVKVCVAAGSGCGGMGSLRVAGSRFGRDTGEVETIGQMCGGMFPHWFLDSVRPYGADVPSAHNRENELRFDADFIGAAIAPRALLILEGLDDTWANPYGTMATFGAVADVYHFLGEDSKCGIHFREGGHALNSEDWSTLLTFCREQVLGEKVDRCWHVRSPKDPVIARDWKADPNEAVPEGNYDFSPEAIAALMKGLNERWVFSEAGLETGVVRFMKKMIVQRMQEKQ